MNKQVITALGLVVALSALGCARQNTQPADATSSATASSPAATASMDEFAAARTNYSKFCETCHGETGDGGTVTIEDKTLKVPSLKKGHAVTHTDQELVKQVLDGGEGMPAFKEKVSTAEATALIEFVRHEFQGK